MLRSTFVCVAAGITVAVSSVMLPSVASAEPVPSIVLPGGQVLNVQGVVGSGQYTSYEVIDFQDTSGPSFAWEYKYDTPVSGYQMLENIAAADPNLTVDSQFFESLGESQVLNLSYGAYTGNASDYWNYWNGTYDSVGQTVDWTDSDVGAGDFTISDGSFDGWYNSFVNVVPPRLPETPLPEPGALGNIFVLESICLLFIRKRRPVCVRSR
jgi:hypothetical protein